MAGGAYIKPSNNVEQVSMYYNLKFKMYLVRNSNIAFIKN